MPEVIFNGPEGRLEGRYYHAKRQGAPIALLLHPHPLHGGSMNNKVVYNLFQGFKRMGFSVLRFNFRGVGRSQGDFDGGVGELSDAASALDWLQAQNGETRNCWICGFSFGAWVAMQLLMRRPEIGGFVSVAPPANMFDFSFLAPCPSSGLIVQGSEDDIVPEPDVAKLVAKLKQQKGIEITYDMMSGAGHFFENELDELIETVTGYVEGRLDAALTPEDA